MHVIQIRRRTALVLTLGAFALAATIFLGGCSGIAYYGQSINGHLTLLRGARPVEEVIADPATTPDTRRRLALALEARKFASEALALPGGTSYTRYAELKRPFVVWNVIAAPALSLTPQTWCFAVAGCVSYRGYFDQTEAQAFASELRTQGLDVNVSGVPAYSTLGKLEWLGGDPLLSTFIRYPEAELAKLIFHELAHQVVYVAGDANFNESFAVAVEREGVRRWLNDRAADPNRATFAVAHASQAARRTGFLQILRSARERLVALYASDADTATKLRQKSAVFAQLNADYAALRAQWVAEDTRFAPSATTQPANRYTGYDAYFARELNNAHLAAIATYTEHVAGFQGLLHEADGDLPRFFVRVKVLAGQPAAARAKALTEAARICAAQPDVCPSL